MGVLGLMLAAAAVDMDCLLMVLCFCNFMYWVW